MASWRGHQRARLGRRAGQAGNPVALAVLSTMHPLAPGLHTEGMPPSTWSSPSDGPLPDWQQVQTLSVADVVMTILKARKAMPSATAATVSRTRHGDGYRVLVSLLEGDQPADEGAVATGGVDDAVAVFVARELGSDLADAFGGKDVIILQ
jgi:hypothetical protein